MAAVIDLSLVSPVGSLNITIDDTPLHALPANSSQSIELLDSRHVLSLHIQEPADEVRLEVQLSPWLKGLMHDIAAVPLRLWASVRENPPGDGLSSCFPPDASLLLAVVDTSPSSASADTPLCCTELLTLSGRSGGSASDIGFTQPLMVPPSADAVLGGQQRLSFRLYLLTDSGDRAEASKLCRANGSSTTLPPASSLLGSLSALRSSLALGNLSERLWPFDPGPALLALQERSAAAAAGRSDGFRLSLHLRHCTAGGGRVEQQSGVAGTLPSPSAVGALARKQPGQSEGQKRESQDEVSISTSGSSQQQQKSALDDERLAALLEGEVFLKFPSSAAASSAGRRGSGSSRLFSALRRAKPERRTVFLVYCPPPSPPAGVATPSPRPRASSFASFFSSSSSASASASSGSKDTLTEAPSPPASLADLWRNGYIVWCKPADGGKGRGNKQDEGKEAGGRKSRSIDRTRAIPLSSVQAIVGGFHSQNGSQGGRKPQIMGRTIETPGEKQRQQLQQQQELRFSVIASSRTLELQAATEGQAQRWVATLQELLRCSKERPASFSRPPAASLPSPAPVGPITSAPESSLEHPPDSRTSSSSSSIVTASTDPLPALPSTPPAKAAASVPSFRPPPIAAPSPSPVTLTATAAASAPTSPSRIFLPPSPALSAASASSSPLLPPSLSLNVPPVLLYSASAPAAAATGASSSPVKDLERLQERLEKLRAELLTLPPEEAEEGEGEEEEDLNGEL